MICYSISFPLTKISLLLLYRRVFQVASFQRIINYVAIAFGAFLIGQLVVVIFTCNPISYFWDQVIDPTGGKCVDIRAFYYAVNIVNIVMDVILLILPISKIWQLQMPTRKKVAICGIFFLGSL